MDREVLALMNLMTDRAEELERRVAAVEAANAAPVQRSYTPALGAAEMGAVDGLFESVKGYIDRRLSKMSGKRGMSFCGPHDPSVTYAAGSVVQRQSQTWVALVDATETPGQSTQWRRLT